MLMRNKGAFIRTEKHDAPNVLLMVWWWYLLLLMTMMIFFAQLSVSLSLSVGHDIMGSSLSVATISLVLLMTGSLLKSRWWSVLTGMGDDQNENAAILCAAAYTPRTKPLFYRIWRYGWNDPDIELHYVGSSCGWLSRSHTGIMILYCSSAKGSLLYGFCGVALNSCAIRDEISSRNFPQQLIRRTQRSCAIFALSLACLWTFSFGAFHA